MTALDGEDYAIWEAYNAYIMQNYVGRRTIPGPYKGRHWKEFVKMATWCVENGINIYEFIKTAFPFITSYKSVIVPKDFNTLPVRKKVMSTQARQLACNPEVDWSLQLALLKNLRWLNPDVKDDIEFLRLMVYPFSPWFRMFYPASIDEKIYNVYGGMVWSDLTADKNLRIFLRKIRPDSMQILESRISSFGD